MGWETQEAFKLRREIGRKSKVRRNTAQHKELIKSLSVRKLELEPSVHKEVL